MHTTEIKLSDGTTKRVGFDIEPSEDDINSAKEHIESNLSKHINSPKESAPAIDEKAIESKAYNSPLLAGKMHEHDVLGKVERNLVHGFSQNFPTVSDGLKAVSNGLGVITGINPKDIIMHEINSGDPEKIQERAANIAKDTQEFVKGGMSVKDAYNHAMTKSVKEDLIQHIDDAEGGALLALPMGKASEILSPIGKALVKKAGLEGAKKIGGKLAAESLHQLPVALGTSAIIGTSVSAFDTVKGILNGEGPLDSAKKAASNGAHVGLAGLAIGMIPGVGKVGFQSILSKAEEKMKEKGAPYAAVLQARRTVDILKTRMNRITKHMQGLSLNTQKLGLDLSKEKEKFVGINKTLADKEAQISALSEMAAVHFGKAALDVTDATHKVLSGNFRQIFKSPELEGTGIDITDIADELSKVSYKEYNEIKYKKNDKSDSAISESMSNYRSLTSKSGISRKGGIKSAIEKKRSELIPSDYQLQEAQRSLKSIPESLLANKQTVSHIIDTSTTSAGKELKLEGLEYLHDLLSKGNVQRVDPEKAFFAASELRKTKRFDTPLEVELSKRKEDIALKLENKVGVLLDDLLPGKRQELQQLRGQWKSVMGLHDDLKQLSGYNRKGSLWSATQYSKMVDAHVENMTKSSMSYVLNTNPGEIIKDLGQFHSKVFAVADNLRKMGFSEHADHLDGLMEGMISQSIDKVNTKRALGNLSDSFMEFSNTDIGREMGNLSETHARIQEIESLISQSNRKKTNLGLRKHQLQDRAEFQEANTIIKDENDKQRHISMVGLAVILGAVRGAARGVDRVTGLGNHITFIADLLNIPVLFAANKKYGAAGAHLIHENLHMINEYFKKIEEKHAQLPYDPLREKLVRQYLPYAIGYTNQEYGYQSAEDNGTDFESSDPKLDDLIRKMNQ